MLFKLKHILKKNFYMNRWSLESWKQYTLDQPPGWNKDINLQSTVTTLKNSPPLVFKNEIQLLKKRLSKVHDRECFIVQGGDCAETFSDFNTSFNDFLEKMCSKVRKIVII